MPGYDGTGPNGQGQMTGRGMGYCAGYPVPGCMNPGFRRGMGQGFGRGRGFRWRQMITSDPQIAQEQPADKEETLEALEDKRKAIEQEIQFFEQGLVEFKKRLKELR